MSDLFAGATLSSGTAEFTDWELVAIDSLTQPGPDLTQIEVVSLADDPLNPGVRLVASGGLSIVGLDNVNLVVKFKVTPSPTEEFVGHSLELSDVTFGGSSGIVFVTGELADGASNPVTSGLVMADKESDFFLTPDQSAFPPEAQLEVTWDVFLTSFSTLSPVTLNSFTHRFAVAAIPEPAGMSLITAIIVLGVACRRFWL